MKYLQEHVNGIYHYRRRVPTSLKGIAEKEVIFISLKTRDKNLATQKAAQINANMQELWDELLINENANQHEKFVQVKKIAKMHGFKYLPVKDLAQEHAEEIIQRINPLLSSDPKQIKTKISALLGGVQKPEMMLSECFEKYEEICKPELLKKSPQQKKKWALAKRHPFEFFIKTVGNKPIITVDRNDVIKLKEKLIERLEKKDITANTFNKYMRAVKIVLRTVANEFQMDIDIDKLFKHMRVTEHNQTRESFTYEFIKDTLLNRKKLDTISMDAWIVIPIMANTGMRPSEVCSLDKSDIILNTDIPHVKVREKEDEERKTIQSERNIPLYGVALEAFKKYPNGLEKYYRKADSLSACVNKYMKENGLKLSKYHTLYSLRHSFEDFMRQKGVENRIRRELMGHAEKGTVYGTITLEEKLDAIKTFAFD